MWWYPPGHEIITMQPSPSSYYLKRLFLWMPRKMWLVNFRCCHCSSHSLTSMGLYLHVRLVLNQKDYYYLAGKYMGCSACGGTFISWDDQMLQQLTTNVQSQFPAVLKRKYACDMAVVTLFRARTLGNSPTALSNNLHEVHSEDWMTWQLSYLGDCMRHKEEYQCVREGCVEQTQCTTGYYNIRVWQDFVN